MSGKRKSSKKTHTGRQKSERMRQRQRQRERERERESENVSEREKNRGTARRLIKVGREMTSVEIKQQ